MVTFTVNTLSRYAPRRNGKGVEVRIDFGSILKSPDCGEFMLGIEISVEPNLRDWTQEENGNNSASISSTTSTS